jgi:hypothetical protein
MVYDEHQNGGIGFCECTASSPDFAILFGFRPVPRKFQRAGYLCRRNFFRNGFGNHRLVLGEQLTDGF